MVGVHGLEPRYTESESAVLPLNYTPIRLNYIGIILFFNQIFLDFLNHHDWCRCDDDIDIIGYL